MEQIVEHLTDLMITNGVISKEEQEVYRYGLEQIIGKIVGSVFILFLALLHKTIWSAILFLIVFYGFRERTGGYHANSRLGCFLTSIMMFLVEDWVFVPIFTDKEIYQILLWILSVGTILILAPMDHENLNLTEYEKRKCKKASRSFVVFVTIILISAFMFRVSSTYSTSILMGMAMDAFLLLLQFIKIRGWNS